MKLTVCSSVDIPLAEGPVNLNWGPIMKTINDSPYDFFQGGGWTFLGGTGEEVEPPFHSQCLFSFGSVVFRANRTKSPKPNPSLKQNLRRSQARQAPMNLGVTLMASMPVMTREAGLTLMMKAKVGISHSCCEICADSHVNPQGEDWDELERKAAKCKANLLSKGISHN